MVTELQDKLEWLPLYIGRIKASSRWQRMKDYQRGWYISLLIESADSAMPGYLPLDKDLWRLAGAGNKAFFDREFNDPVNGLVRQCFQSRQVNGREWIYNERMLRTISEQSQKLEKKGRGKRTPISSLSVSSDFVLCIWKDYPRKEGSERGKHEISRAIAWLIQNGTGEIRRGEQIESVAITSEIDASRFIHEAVIEFAKSPAANAIEEKTGRSLCPHPSTWFHQRRFMDDRSQWYQEGALTPREQRDLSRALEGTRRTGIEDVKAHCYFCDAEFDWESRRKSVSGAKEGESLFCSDKHANEYRNLRAEAVRRKVTMEVIMRERRVPIATHQQAEGATAHERS